ncbi:efflux transporter outer membrane subunit [Sphingomonas histidinilytica]|uniref:Efflux transporter, outer membrane factor (OMF) lipoprotein, NodT family n=1 Tax=Rhizorhabdus histidinilytica TaxID=439228 RepID=A0A1T5AAD5_9SPHN|nr:efflux transporter outer membrane subunit [Rhizorhabdus histidinilytica]MBO9377311.1 efflux transporter outer membrane subunit [Rhizorhabdus histidinilytica]SKB31633.1 efflux transporter, outer membrane factor (OMF) lipoprotein, NodT family [Rhizorhabdus histidinilytica]
MRRSGLLLPLLLGGCAAGQVKPVAVPAVDAPAAWRTAAPLSAVERDWWAGFGDPALTALVDRALVNNSDIGIAAGRVREARANLAAARATLLPTLDASLTGARSRSISAFGTSEVQNAAQPQLQAAYEIDLFGRLADQRSAARNAYLASEAARDAVRLAIASATASSYVALLGLDTRLDIARRTLAARETSLRIARSRVSNGYSPKLELQQAQAEYDATAAIVPQIELAVARTEHGLNLLTGDTPQAVGRGATLATLAQPPLAGGLPSELLRRRPDIAQAERQLAAADSSLAVARKRFLPQLRLSATAGAAFSSLLDDPLTLWQLGGSILAPIFQGGRLTAQAEAAAGQRDQAAFAYRKAVLTGFREVEDALASVRRIEEQTALAIHQRDTLAEALRLATNRYREGYSPYLEQLDAQRQLLAAELNLAQLQSDGFAARIQLYQALGGGWSAADGESGQP